MKASVACLPRFKGPACPPTRKEGSVEDGEEKGREEKRT